jgi:hypothetical protein
MELQGGTKQCDHPEQVARGAKFFNVFWPLLMGNIDDFTFDREQLTNMNKTSQKHWVSTLNHNLAYWYSDACVIKWMWEHVKRGFRGGARGFED